MSKTYDAIMSEQVLEPSRELTENELAQVSGGIIAILVGLAPSGLGSAHSFAGDGLGSAHAVVGLTEPSRLL